MRIMRQSGGIAHIYALCILENFASLFWLPFTEKTFYAPLENKEARKWLI